MDEKRKAILIDLWKELISYKDLNKRVADLTVENEKSYFDLLNISDIEDSKKYFENMENNLDKFKESLDGIIAEKFALIEKRISELSEEQVEAYHKDFLKKD